MDDELSRIRLVAHPKNPTAPILRCVNCDQLIARYAKSPRYRHINTAKEGCET